MRKSLLTLLLAAATLTVSAQLKVGQIQPKASATVRGMNHSFLKGSNLLTSKEAEQWKLPEFNKQRATRAGEERPEKNYLYNYVIPSEGIDFNLFYSESYTTPYEFSTYYSPELLKRYIGNTITEFSTIISAQSSEVTFYIASSNDLTSDDTDIYYQISTPYDDLSSSGELYQAQDASGNPVPLGLGIAFQVDNPIVITEEIAEKGLFVGYYATLDQSKCLSLGRAVGISEGIFAVLYADGYMSGSAILNDIYYSGVAWLTDLYTEGDAGLLDNDAALVYLSSARAETGDGADLILQCVNYGVNPITSISFKAIYNDQEEIINKTTNIPFAAYAIIPISLEELVNGRKSYKVSVNNVNGMKDEFTEDNDIESVVIATDNPAQPKAVMEEGTGTWCGWCPRGMIAMEQLQKDYSDDFIPIAVHYRDILQSNTYVTIAYAIGSVAGGYPSATLNRYIFGDPYYGNITDENGNEVNYGISENVEEILDTPVEAEVGVESTLSADKKTVDVTSHVRFNIPCNAGEYSIAYAITEDKVSDPNLIQTNSFAMYPAQDFGSDLNILKSHPYDWAAEFNHVARAIWDAYGIEGSLEGQVANDQVTSHKMTLELPETILNTDNCHLIAMLIDNYDGMIVNACRVALGQSDATGISSSKNDVLNAQIGVANGNISINGNGVANIYTVDGKLVSKAAVNGQAEINVPAGSYVVRVTDGNNVVVKKVAL